MANGSKSTEGASSGVDDEDAAPSEKSGWLSGLDALLDRDECECEWLERECGDGAEK